MKDAIRDVIDGTKQYEFWVTFGKNDIKSRHRRSVLGQWWITLSVAVFIFAIGGLYRGAFEHENGNYLLYFSVGYIVWQFISATVNGSSQILNKSEAFIRQNFFGGYSVYLYRLVYREVLVFAHHSVIFPIVLLIVGWEHVPSVIGLLLALLGMSWVILTAFFGGIIVSIVAVRWPDFVPIIQNLVRLAFFATPIIWREGSLGATGLFVSKINPFAHYIAIVRDPLLAEGSLLNSWAYVLVFTSMVIGLAFMALGYAKRKLIFWL
ncbi:O-antigen export system permease protein RfbD (plasmid) [Maritalea myrionectae]|uniref:O-antigen export system permease protein RfbD n=2 Tax=Maritalea myrionectae TaxID=454601 RepID=A0A2R4MJZ4_9HYPH|nr:O-antigen export system permease protein RfbD [Maritalea myrionectae]